MSRYRSKEIPVRHGETLALLIRLAAKRLGVEELAKRANVSPERVRAAVKRGAPDLVAEWVRMTEVAYSASGVPAVNSTESAVTGAVNVMPTLQVIDPQVAEHAFAVACWAGREDDAQRLRDLAERNEDRVQQFRAGRLESALAKRGR